MPVTPDIEGFVNAQVRLREQFGQDVPFYFGSASVWPPGTPLDPETGNPYDPTILPVSSGAPSAMVPNVSVVHRPMGLSRRGIAGEEVTTAVGRFEEGEAALIVGPADFDTYSLDEAKWVEVHEEEWEITSFDADALGSNDTQRYILYIRKR